MTQSTPAPEAIPASASIQLSQAQMKLLLHLQMLQKQSGDGTTQVTLLVSRQRIRVTHPVLSTTLRKRIRQDPSAVLAE